MPIACTPKRPKGAVKRLALGSLILESRSRPSRALSSTGNDVRRLLLVAASTIRRRAAALERLHDDTRQRRTPTGREDENPPTRSPVSSLLLSLAFTEDEGVSRLQIPADDFCALAIAGAQRDGRRDRFSAAERP